MYVILKSNVRHITIYSSFTSNLWFLNVCVVIAGYHNHIINGWWKLKKYVGWELLAMYPV